METARSFIENLQFHKDPTSHLLETFDMHVKELLRVLYISSSKTTTMAE
jgi:hypothetical protein